jgi:translation initiation factor 1
MPFTFDGQRIPAEDPSKKKSGPVKVRLVKRKHSVLTVILNLSLSEKELIDLASKIKKKLGCGGAVKGSDIEIQGDKVELVKKILEEVGIKSS